MVILSNEQLGAAVRLRRKELKMTQGDLAMACGTGLRFIVDLEKGKPTCHMGKALIVLRSLGLAVDIRPARATAERGGAQ